MELSEDLAGEVAAQSREIEAQEHFISLVIDTLPVGLYVVDRDYRIQIWNRKRETGTQGLRRGEVVGRPVFDVLTRQSREQLRAEFDRVFATGEIQQSELEVAHGDEVRHFRLSKIPMRLDGDAITHVITIGEDVTEWQAVQGQILQAEKLAAIGQLAAGVMHEINNPLATIGACVAAIQGRLEDGGTGRDAIGEYLRDHRQGSRAVHRDRGSAARLQPPQAEWCGPRCRWTRWWRRPSSCSSTTSGSRVSTVTRELAPGLPSALGSREQLIQVLMALLLNAADAMEQGGTLTIRTGRVPGRAGEVFLEVADTGPGIPREDQDRDLRAVLHHQAAGAGDRPRALSICYAIVEAHQGRIEVDSAPGRGARFRVHLPVAAAA